MAEPSRNVELAREGLEAFNRGDVEAVHAFIDPEIVSHVSPAMLNSGSWRGIAGYEEMIAGWNDAWDDLDFEIQGIDAVGDRHVIARVRQTAVGRESGVPVTMDVAFLFEVVEGRARRFEIHPDTAAAEAAI